MTMMKKIMMICLLAIGVAAQPVMAQSDAKAKAVLEKVNNKFKQLKSIKADFIMSISGNGVTDSKKGTFYMKGKKYRIKMEGQEIITDNKSVWVYMKDMNEVNVNNYNASEQTISPEKIFSGSYQNDYNYKYAGTGTVNGKSCDVIQLDAKSGSTNINKVKLFIDKSNNTIVQSVMNDRAGNMYKYQITNFNTNANLSDNLFTYNKSDFPGAELVDLR